MRNLLRTSSDIVEELRQRFDEAIVMVQSTGDAIPTLWVMSPGVRDLLRYLKEDTERPYPVLYDLCAIDERVHACRDTQPASALTVVYHLLSYEHNADVRIKVALQGEYPSLPSIVDIWPAARVWSEVIRLAKGYDEEATAEADPSHANQAAVFTDSSKLWWNHSLSQWEAE